MQRRCAPFSVLLCCFYALPLAGFRTNSIFAQSSDSTGLTNSVTVPSAVLGIDKNLITRYTYDEDNHNLLSAGLYSQDAPNTLISGALILMSSEDGTELYFYPDADGSIGSFKYKNVQYYYVRNAQNDVIGITDKTGAIVARYTYDEWGNTTSITDANGNDVSGNANHIANLNPLRYRSYYYDAETGWYWLNTRYYDPAIGRFINADGYASTGQGILGHNMFAYCGNNPINRVDQTGLFWQEFFNFIENAAKIVAEVAENAAKSAQSIATSCCTNAKIIAGGVYSSLPNGLSTSLIAQSNKLQAINTGASSISKAVGAVGWGLVAIDCVNKVVDNVNNDELTTTRKITDSIIDVNVTVGAAAIGAAIGTAIPIPVVGTVVGAAVGMGVDYVVKNTPIVSWYKETVGNAINAVGSFFGKIFG